MMLREYVADSGRSPFGDWFKKLDPVTAAKVTTALTRLELGNVSNVKVVGSGVCELKIDFGPGYRIYFGKDGVEVVILLGGGTKKKQRTDIVRAHSHWQYYRARKRGST